MTPKNGIPLNLQDLQENNSRDAVIYRLNQLEQAIAIYANKLKAKQYTTQQEALIMLELIKKFKKEYRITRSEIDILYFAYEYFSEDKNEGNKGNLMPTGCTVENAPAFHWELCNKLNELADFPTRRICWSVPRGHAKSAYLSNVFPIHQIVFNKRNYIIIISETEKMSVAFVEWIGEELKFNVKLREDFGELLSTKKLANEQDNKEGFVTLNKVKVQSASIGKQLRGARFGSHRPDLVILDDLESAKNTNTNELREKNLHWFNSVVMPIGDITKTSYIYMGTLVHGKGLLPHVLNRSDFDGRIYSAITGTPKREDLWEKYENILKDIDNEQRQDEAEAFYFENQQAMNEGADTLWASRFSYKDLINIKVNVGSRAFASEYLNVPSDSESCIFKREYFSYYNDLDLRVEHGRYYNGDMRALDIYSFWDIAIGKNKRSDYNAIVTIGRDRRTGVIYVLDCWAEKIAMHKALEVALHKIKVYQPKIFGVETVQAQYDMYRQLQEKCFKQGIYNTRLLAVNPRGKKEDRIEQLEPLVEQGYIRFHKTQRLLLEQLEFFGNGAEHDDTCDALASVIDIAGKQRKRTYYRKPAGV